MWNSYRSLPISWSRFDIFLCSLCYEPPCPTQPFSRVIRKHIWTLAVVVDWSVPPVNKAAAARFGRCVLVLLPLNYIRAVDSSVEAIASAADPGRHLHSVARCSSARASLPRCRSHRHNFTDKKSSQSSTFNFNIQAHVTVGRG